MLTLRYYSYFINYAHVTLLPLFINYAHVSLLPDFFPH